MNQTDKKKKISFPITRAKWLWLYTSIKHRNKNEKRETLEEE